MGYDVKRFIGEINDEFHCPICAMVLENPVQSPCEHIFCNECIKEWLSSECSCPVDRKSLQVDDLKLAARYFRNMLDKLEMKCDFELEGCGNIEKLNHLKDHIKDCEYNPNAKVVCDKGCNLKITRQEYRINNCFSHLAKQLACKNMEISELRQELSDLNSSMKLKFDHQEKDTVEFKEKLLRQEERFENEINELRKTIGKLCYRCNVFEMPQKWGTNSGMKFHSENQNILEFETHSTFLAAFAESFYVLNPESNSFKIEILDMIDANDAIRIGVDEIVYSSNGYIHLGEGEFKFHSRNWKVGDIIEIGIKFPKNFINDGTNRANFEINIYFSLNEEIIFESPVKIPSVGLYPRVEMYRIGSKIKIKYLQLK